MNQQNLIEMFKGVDGAYTPIIVKACTKGALETVLQEVNKIIINVPEIQILTTGIGAITEFDIQIAEESNAIMFGFDLKMP